MRSLASTVAAGLMAALALFAGTVTPVAAAPAQTFLVLQLQQGDTFTGLVLARVTLRCDPDGGEHPRPFLTCTTLRAVNGDFTRLTRDGTPCPLNFDPVTAHAVGQWRGRAIRFANVYSNRCFAGEQTKGVFRF